MKNMRGFLPTSMKLISLNYFLGTFIGGSGWTTLADEANDLLFVVKSSLKGDITYGPMSKARINMNSWISKNSTVEFRTAKHFNLGMNVILI